MTTAKTCAQLLVLSQVGHQRSAFSFVYLRDVIDRVSAHPARLVLELTPREWTRLRKDSAAKAAA
jgi:hypothetical protein